MFIKIMLRVLLNRITFKNFIELKQFHLFCLDLHFRAKLKNIINISINNKLFIQVI